jgi:hypothetical protein
MSDPSFVIVDVLLALSDEGLSASVRAKSAAKETIRIPDQPELAMTVRALVQVTRLLLTLPP